MSLGRTRGFLLRLMIHNVLTQREPKTLAHYVSVLDRINGSSLGDILQGHGANTGHLGLAGVKGGVSKQI